jgi:hypothetical protein
MNDDDAKAAGLEVEACRTWQRLEGMLLRSLANGGARQRLGFHDGDEFCTVTRQSIRGPLVHFNSLTPSWPDLRDAATFGAALGWLQSQSGHNLGRPCPVLAAAAFGVGSHEAVRALVDAFKAADGREEVAT